MRQGHGPPRTWLLLELRRESGGLRHYLGARPVHAGTGLLLRLPAGQEARVRYEGVWGADTLRALLFLNVADEDGDSGPSLVLGGAESAAVDRFAWLAWPEGRR